MPCRIRRREFKIQRGENGEWMTVADSDSPMGASITARHQSRLEQAWYRVIDPQGEEICVYLRGNAADETVGVYSRSQEPPDA